MSRHEGVSCDSCLKGNFRGRRYKCLICYDYDLCASCYEAGATTTRHTVDHPMQCILTNSDFDLFYSGEAFTVDQPQSFTCPVCGKLGYTGATLTDHVTSEHSDATNEVVCPICASQFGGEPNLVTDDFTNHLMSEHRNNQRDLISFLDEPSTATRNVRRIPHPGGGANSSRPRRTNMHFSSTAAMSSLSPSANRDNVDPIAELLSQLSGVRRGNPGPTSVHLQQLQMQLQLERQQVRAARQQLERIPKRQSHSVVSSSAAGSYSTPAVTTVSSSNVSSATSVTGSSKAAIQPSSASGEVITASSYSIAHPQNHPQTIISKILDTVASESELQFMDVERADRSIFMKNILLSTLNSKKDEPPVYKNRRTPPSIVKASSSTTTTVESIVSLIGTSESSSSSVLTKPAEQPAPSSSTTLKRLSATTKSVLPPSQIPQQPRSSLCPATPNSNGTSNNQSSTSSLPPPPPPSSLSATAGQNRTAVSTAPPTTPRVLHSPNNLGNIRDVLVGSNFSTETSRRKPICPIETLNQTSEPPTSH